MGWLKPPTSLLHEVYKQWFYLTAILVQFKSQILKMIMETSITSSWAFFQQDSDYKSMFLPALSTPPSPKNSPGIDLEHASSQWHCTPHRCPGGRSGWIKVWRVRYNWLDGGNSNNYFSIFTPKIGEESQFDEHIFSNGLKPKTSWTWHFTSPAWKFNNEFTPEHFPETPKGKDLFLKHPFFRGEVLKLWGCNSWYLKMKNNGKGFQFHKHFFFWGRVRYCLRGRVSRIIFQEW